MNRQQFEALAKLMSLRDSPSALAAKLHFVGGMRIMDAAHEAECSTRAAMNCITRCRKALALAQTVTQPTKETT